MTLRRRHLLTASCALVAAAILALPPTSPLAQPGKIEVLWLGHATFKITSKIATTDGKVIVIDPFLTSNPKAPSEYKPKANLPNDYKKVGKVDLILLTHGHGDHIEDVKGLAAVTHAKVYGADGLISTLVYL